LPLSLNLQGVAIGFAFMFGGMAGGIATSKAGPVPVINAAAGFGGLAALAALAMPETNTNRAASVDVFKANPLNGAGTLWGASYVSLGCTASFLLAWVALNTLQ